MLVVAGISGVSIGVFFRFDFTLVIEIRSFIKIEGAVVLDLIVVVDRGRSSSRGTR
jgi:hypothetical protein